MHFGAGTYSVGLLAGALSTLSPCVLPLIPVLVASAISSHRWGAFALGLGLALSFAAVGIFLATLGVSTGIDPDAFRLVGAISLAIFGVILLVPPLQDLFARATSSLSNSGNQWLGSLKVGGLTGQFLVGVLLGTVWSPCVGPTLGAATTLASQGQELSQIALLMLIFGIGAAAPLVLLGTLSRARMMRIREGLLTVGTHGKKLFGFVVLVLGVSIATGADKLFESRALDWTPQWLTALTTKF